MVFLLFVDDLLNCSYSSVIGPSKLNNLFLQVLQHDVFYGNGRAGNGPLAEQPCEQAQEAAPKRA